MDFFQEYFLCDDCENKDFKRIYHFYLRFHNINFSDDLVYDRLTDEIYQCTKCNKTFNKNQVEEGLLRIKKKHKKKDLE